MDAYIEQLTKITAAFNAVDVHAEVANVGDGCLSVAVFPHDDDRWETALAGGMGGYDDPLSFDIFDPDTGDQVDTLGGYLAHDATIAQLVEAVAVNVVFAALRRAADLRFVNPPCAPHTVAKGRAA
jgi:hypothetical protein